MTSIHRNIILSSSATRSHATPTPSSPPSPKRLPPHKRNPSKPLPSLPPRPKPPPDSDIEEFFVKGSGPGGQKINKTSSAVQLKHIPTGIVVKSQATRSRSQNRKHARQLLAQRLDHLLNGNQSRAAAVGHVKKKRADSAAKKSRRKYKKLDEDKASAAGAEQEPSHENDREDIPEQQDNATIPAGQADRRNKLQKP
ncbi:RF-1 domain-containing protein [Hirsutella rhossiliensis]|uniref:RF-1 domain-containing protein n=1 Tax=Hirsutella rhossiliensis TaxID=111463 RepID=A0A9P8MZV5_9HYPO|nr:RF-1 domain-containing protein [Hirsutella rhossiliensis]KAH0965098.1 RF-1 domain-containing protein [Hirsutella rhossiliensis]